mgnify:CR=1 FL=1
MLWAFKLLSQKEKYIKLVIVGSNTTDAILKQQVEGLGIQKYVDFEGWQNENLDYSQYAENFVMRDTGFGVDNDSISLQEMIENDKMMWKNYDFKLMNSPVLLPGVNTETKMADGSVRHYSDWEITLAAGWTTGFKN